MDDKKGIWVSKVVPTAYGDVTVSMRLDTAIDPKNMLERLDKERDALDKKLDKALAKLNALNEKTPAKIMDAAVKEVLEIHNLQTHNSKEWWRWEEALYQQELEECNDPSTDNSK